MYLKALKSTMENYHAAYWSSDPFRLSSSEEEEETRYIEYLIIIIIIIYAI